jgi:hypothetical protein
MNNSQRCDICGQERSDVVAAFSATICGTCAYQVGELGGTLVRSAYDMWTEYRRNKQEAAVEARCREEMAILVDGLIGKSLDVVLPLIEDLAYALQPREWTLFQQALQSRTNSNQNALIILGRARRIRPSGMIDE